MKAILKRHPYILIFGVLQIFFSAPGQTFLIALFVSHIFKELGISLSLFAGIYSAATLSASLFLNPAGRLIDKYPIKNIVMAVTVFMALGCWLLAAAQNGVMVFCAFFILRLIGQGVFGLAASTLIIKKFEKNRGKAMGLIMLGFPFSEVVYPVTAFFLIQSLGWRMSYVLFGLSMLLLMLPVQLYLLTKSRLRMGQFLPGEELINPQRMPGHPEERKIRVHEDFTLGQVLRDIKFYLILLASCLPGLVVTGLFFHQEALFHANGWPITQAAAGIGMYAFSKAVGSVWVGPVVDKHGPFIPFITIILMLAAATFFASVGQSPYTIYVYFIILGAALGFSSPVMNVIWPYFYGAKHMGSIKGMVATFRNGLTALGPLPIALCLDAGFTMNQILIWISIGIFLMTSLPAIVWVMDRK